LCRGNFAIVWVVADKKAIGFFARAQAESVPFSTKKMSKRRVFNGVRHS
jgi:hypothetical protein